MKISHGDIDAQVVFYKIIHSGKCLQIKLKDSAQVLSPDFRHGQACARIDIGNQAGARCKMVSDVRGYAGDSARF